MIRRHGRVVAEDGRPAIALNLVARGGVLDAFVLKATRDAALALDDVGEDGVDGGDGESRDVEGGEVQGEEGGDGKG